MGLVFVCDNKGKKMPQLFVLQGSQSGQIYPFTQRITIGYHPDCDIVLTGGSDDQLAMVLLEIVSHAGSYYLRKKTEISVTINGQEVKDDALQHGNIIAVGNIILLFNAASQGSLLQANAVTTQGMPSTKIVSQERQRLLSLYQAANLIYSSSDLKELVEELAKFLLHTFDAGSCIILLKESYCDDLRVVMYKKNDRYSSELEDLQLQLTRKKLNLVYQKRKALLWRDWRCNRGFYFMAAPLSHYHKTLGLVLLESKAVKKISGQQPFQPFSEQDLYILGETNLIVANGIANILNYLEKKEHTRRLENLNKVTVKLSSLLNKKAIYREAARDVCSILKCTKSSVMYVDDHQIIRMGYAVGIHKQYYRKIATPYGKGLVGWVIEHGKSLLSSSLPNSLHPKCRQKYRTDSFLIVPIFKSSGKKAETIGAICATDRLDKIPFSRHDKELLTLIARQVGIALTNASLYEQATVDFLTRIYLRGYFFEKMAETLEHVRQNGENISLLMLDLDFFKSVNDTYGHQAGDVTLQELGSIFNKSIREGDLAGRYGGEEFIILLSNSTYSVAYKIAERIRWTVENHSFQVENTLLHLTISIGVAEYIRGESAEDLILRADRALYQAKESGRNRVC